MSRSPPVLAPTAPAPTPACPFNPTGVAGYPLDNSVVLFAQSRPTYSGQAGEGLGSGWQHHIGSGISLSF
jgi:hypothetical protein